MPPILGAPHLVMEVALLEFGLDLREHAFDAPLAGANVADQGQRTQR